MYRLLAAGLAALLLGLAPGARAAEPVARVGVLKFGTVNWELDVVKHHKLDAAQGITVDIVELASNQATQVALQGGAADLIVADWLWVTRQRAQGADYTFVPYSTAVGAVMVPADGPVRSLGDLKGRRLGVAGGPLDKGWLLLRALAVQSLGFDPAKDARPVYGAPPLLNEQVQQGGVEAVLNYWNYAARLSAAGYRRLAGIDEVERGLGLDRPLPMIGYVFSEKWAAANPQAIQGFVRATRAANAILRDSDAEWQRLEPLMKAENPAVFAALRDGYRAGIPTSWGEAERADAARIYGILARIGGPELVGDAPGLQPGTFWPGLSY
jgi:NitT/TauT family transport system substrate-binding protein